MRFIKWYHNISTTMTHKKKTKTIPIFFVEVWEVGGGEASASRLSMLLKLASLLRSFLRACVKSSAKINHNTKISTRAPRVPSLFLSSWLLSLCLSIVSDCVSVCKKNKKPKLTRRRRRASYYQRTMNDRRDAPSW